MLDIGHMYHLWYHRHLQWLLQSKQGPLTTKQAIQVPCEVTLADFSTATLPMAKYHAPTATSRNSSIFVETDWGTAVRFWTKADYTRPNRNSLLKRRGMEITLPRSHNADYADVRVHYAWRWDGNRAQVVHHHQRKACGCDHFAFVIASYSCATRRSTMSFSTTSQGVVEKKCAISIAMRW